MSVIFMCVDVEGSTAVMRYPYVQVQISILESAYFGCPFVSVSFLVHYPDTVISPTVSPHDNLSLSTYLDGI